MIVHVSTNQSGGAGSAARRLHLGLLKGNMDSHFVSALGTPDASHNLEILRKRYPRFWQRAARKLRLGLTSQEAWSHTTSALNCTNVFTSSIDSDSTLLEHSLVRNASIINLHWVAGILPWQRFFSTVQCPVVWTLHDMNPFMGIFHYQADRQRGSDQARQLDDQIRARKKQMLQRTKVPPIIVTPSKWLGGLSQQSDLFSGLRHEHIPYGLNTNVFKPYPQIPARSVFDLPPDRKLLLVVAERLDDYRKGFDLLLESVSQSDLRSDWDLVAVGRGDFPSPNMRCHHIGEIQDERLMALLYASADLTVIASREDNLPNVILESLCCGTPVVGTPAGGIPEAIVVNRDGVIASSMSAAGLASALHVASTTLFDRELIAGCAATRYSDTVSAERYLSVYRSVCGRFIPGHD